MNTPKFADITPTGPQGDFGMLSSGMSGEPATGTPFPAYYGYELASILAGPDAQLQAAAATGTLHRAGQPRRRNANCRCPLLTSEPY